MFTKRETNICKGIAIILMLFHHLFNDFAEYEGYVVNYAPFTADRLRYLALLSKACVSIFVFLSGYGIAATYRKRFGNENPPSAAETLRFTWNRYWKLMTVFWFAFLLTLICQPLGRTVFDAYGRGKKSSFVYFLVDLFGLASFFDTPSLNGTWWYMSVAIAIIVLMPFVMRLMQSFGAFLSTAACVILLTLLRASNMHTIYLFSMMLGAFCFETQLFERFERLGGRRKRLLLPVKVICVSVILVGLVSCRAKYNYLGIVDGMIALSTALLVSTVLTRIPGISSVMEFLGRHSTNMFLVHNQIYSHYFPDFFYSFGHWALILAALVAVSLAVSVAMEFVKRRTGYNHVMARFGEWVPEHIFQW